MHAKTSSLLSDCQCQAVCSDAMSEGNNAHNDNNAITVIIIINTNKINYKSTNHLAKKKNINL